MQLRLGQTNYWLGQHGPTWFGPGQKTRQPNCQTKRSDVRVRFGVDSMRCDAIAWQNLLIRRIEIVLGGAIWKICTTNFTRIFLAFFFVSAHVFSLKWLKIRTETSIKIRTRVAKYPNNTHTHTVDYKVGVAGRLFNETKRAADCRVEFGLSGIKSPRNPPLPCNTLCIFGSVLALAGKWPLGPLLCVVALTIKQWQKSLRTAIKVQLVWPATSRQRETGKTIKEPNWGGHLRRDSQRIFKIVFKIFQRQQFMALAKCLAWNF